MLIHGHLSEAKEARFGAGIWLYVAEIVSGRRNFFFSATAKCNGA